MKKTSAMKSETLYWRSYQKLMWQSIKRKFIIGRSWSSANLFIVQNYTKNANGGCAFNI